MLRRMMWLTSAVALCLVACSEKGTPAPAAATPKASAAAVGGKPVVAKSSAAPATSSTLPAAHPTVGGGDPALPSGHPPIPGAALPSGHPTVPAGHPPVGPVRPELRPKQPGPPAAPAVAPGAAPAPSAEGPSFSAIGLALTAPEGWQRQAPRSSMRVAQFGLSAAEGAEAGEVSVIGAGGSVEANIDRWKKQFAGDVETSTVTKDIAGGKIHHVTINGTYLYQARPMAGPTESKPGWRVRGLIFEVQGGLLFVKGWGPKATMDKHEAGFHALAASAKPADG